MAIAIVWPSIRCSSCLRSVNEAPRSAYPCKTGLEPVEPERAGRRDMKFHFGMGLEPILVLPVGVEVMAQ
jgi:hypothetical protein